MTQDIALLLLGFCAGVSATCFVAAWMIRQELKSRQDAELQKIPEGPATGHWPH